MLLALLLSVSATRPAVSAARPAVPKTVLALRGGFNPITALPRAYGSALQPVLVVRADLELQGAAGEPHGPLDERFLLDLDRLPLHRGQPRGVTSRIAATPIYTVSKTY